ncbi:MAG: Smr protein/MutS2 [Rhizobacter sp.]|nr:Smr protein/MutS2 [Rhizobacter sp.]
MTVQSLQDLGPWVRMLEQAQQLRLAEEQRLREERARALRERTLFASTVGPVEPIKDRGRATLLRELPPPYPVQRQLDEARALQETMSDEIDVESLLDTDDELSFRRPELGIGVVKKLRRGHWSLQAQVDLHGLRRDQARERLGEFLRSATRAGYRCVRVIHGKGNGSPGKAPVLKTKVRGWLIQKDEVLAFVQARPSDGGAGALVVLLKSVPLRQQHR